MTSALIENLVEQVTTKHKVSPHILFDEIANTLNERFHNYFVVDSLDDIDFAFRSENFIYESKGMNVTVEESISSIGLDGFKLGYTANPERVKFINLFKTK